MISDLNLSAILSLSLELKKLQIKRSTRTEKKLPEALEAFQNEIQSLLEEDMDAEIPKL